MRYAARCGHEPTLQYLATRRTGQERACACECVRVCSYGHMEHVPLRPSRYVEPGTAKEPDASDRSPGRYAHQQES